MNDTSSTIVICSIVFAILFAICFCVNSYDKRCKMFAENGYEQGTIRNDVPGYWIKVK